MTDPLDSSPPRHRDASSEGEKSTPPSSSADRRHRGPKPSNAIMMEPRSLYNSPLRRSNNINCSNYKYNYNYTYTTTSIGTGKRVFNSPRIDTPDEQLFPAAAITKTNASASSSERGDISNGLEPSPPVTNAAVLSLSDSLARWRYMATLAGRHHQPHDRLRVNLDRVEAPAALLAGMPRGIGRLIRTLHLPIANDASQLPEWLDAIATVFPNLLHLHLHLDGDGDDDNVDHDQEVKEELQRNEKEQDQQDQQDGCATTAPTTTTVGGLPGEPTVCGLVGGDNNKPKTISDEMLVRRLYVLYRLPQLQSMDGEPFTEQEQKLSRPRDHRRHPADDGSAEAADTNDDDDVAVPIMEQQQKKQPQQRRRPSGGGRSKELNESCLVDDSSDEEEREAVVQTSNNSDGSTLAAKDREFELDLNGRPMAMSSCDPDRWEYASVESGAVACEWACGSLSLPYFQRNDTRQHQRKKNKKIPLQQSRLTVRAGSSSGGGTVGGGRRLRPQQQQPLQQQLKQVLPQQEHQQQRQTVVSLNQFTFEESIEVDNAVSTVLVRCLRVSTPPSEKAMLVLDHPPDESPVSSSSSSHSRTGGSQKSNQENVVSLRTQRTQSLTSPFPMQFRSHRGVTERVDKLIGAISEVSDHTMVTFDSHQTAPILPLARIQSSPSNLSMKPQAGGKKNRPPPCPGRRAPLGTRPQRTKPRRQNKWRERLNARSNSILDDDDDADDDNDDEQEQAKEDDAAHVNKEETTLEPKGLRST